MNGTEFLTAQKLRASSGCLHCWCFLLPKCGFYLLPLEPRGQMLRGFALVAGRAQTGNVRYNSSACAEVQPGYFSAGICEFVRNSYSGRGHSKNKEQKCAFKEKSESEKAVPLLPALP